jgi:hypothetical protein
MSAVEANRSRPDALISMDSPERESTLMQEQRLSLSALAGDGGQMIIASSSISAIPITSTATATGS